MFLFYSARAPLRLAWPVQPSAHQHPPRLTAAQDFPAIGPKESKAGAAPSKPALSARPSLPGGPWATAKQQPQKPNAWAQVVKGPTATATPKLGPTEPSGLTPALASLSALTPASASTCSTVETLPPAAAVSEGLPPAPAIVAPVAAPALPSRRILTAADMVRGGHAVVGVSAAARTARTPASVSEAAALTASAAAGPATDSSPHSYVAAAAMRLVRQVSGDDDVAAAAATDDEQPAPKALAFSREVSRAATPVESSPSSPMATSPLAQSSPRADATIVDAIEADALVPSAMPSAESSMLPSALSSALPSAAPTPPPPDLTDAPPDLTDAPADGRGEQLMRDSPARKVLTLTAPMPSLSLPLTAAGDVATAEPSPSRVCRRGTRGGGGASGRAPPSSRASPVPSTDEPAPTEDVVEAAAPPPEAAAPPAEAAAPPAPPAPPVPSSAPAPSSARVHQSPCKRSGDRLESPTEGRSSAAGRAAEGGGSRREQPKLKKQATGGGRERAEQRVERGGGVTGPRPTMHFVPLQPPPPPVPAACHFHGASTSLALPSNAALAQVDRAVARFFVSTRDAAAALDGPATELMARVQTEVHAIWPRAIVNCFGSRATGLAGANSDVDLVVTNVPGLDSPPDGSLDVSNGPMAAQLEALHKLLPRLSSVPSVASATVNRSSVPVIALTAEVSAPSADADGAKTSLAAADGGEQPAGPAGETDAPPAPKTTLSMDVSFHTPQHRGLVAAGHVRWLLMHLPYLPPLVMLLKALLHKHGLKTTFTGGLSSYALVTMVARFLLDRHALGYSRPPQTPDEPAPTAPPMPPMPPAADAAAPADHTHTHATPTLTEGEAPREAPPTPAPIPQLPPGAPVAGGMYVPVGLSGPSGPSLGALLLELLTFYADVFEPSRHAILGSYGLFGAPPPGCGFVERVSLGPLVNAHVPPPPHRRHKPLKLKREDPFPMEPLVCVDPTDLANNTAKACYRVGQLQKLFRAAAKAVAATADAHAAAIKEGGAPHPQDIVEAFLAADSARE